MRSSGKTSRLLEVVGHTASCWYCRTHCEKRVEESCVLMLLMKVASGFERRSWRRGRRAHCADVVYTLPVSTKLAPHQLLLQRTLRPSLCLFEIEVAETRLCSGWRAEAHVHGSRCSLLPQTSPLNDYRFHEIVPKATNNRHTSRGCIEHSRVQYFHGTA